MTTLFEPAYGKLNLTLDILGKREDGYHDLKSVMQTVSLQDDIEIDVGTGKPWCLKCDKEGVPCDERNLAWKAAKVFSEAMGKDPQGIEISMIKRIPSQAGMGGGSADAAAVLRALNKHYGNPLSDFELADLGARVGSDVPFCVVGGTCLCEGRGEILTKRPDMPGCYFVLCKPEFSVSTPELFRKIDAVEIIQRPDHAAMDKALAEGALEQVANNVWNTFDPVVSETRPELEDIKTICNQNGALCSQMTGSGSVVFAIAAAYDVAERISNALKPHYPNVFICKPV